MYEAFYGFSEDPFRISPDHRFSYPHQSYVKAKDYLEYGLLRGEGIVVVTGEPGTGKSTVINDLLSDYDSDELVVAKLLTTRIDSYDLLRMLAYSFGLDALTMDRATVLTQLEQFLIALFDSDRRALLVVDEAQNLTIDALEELRLLSNLQQDEHPLLQIFLIGQPNLQDLIRNPTLEQLRQRLVAACHFEPLKSEETRHYVEHRLRVVGWKQNPEITDDAFELIHHFSAGIPRRVNLICSRLLLHGHVESLHKLAASDVRQVIAELPPEMKLSDNIEDLETTSELSSANAAGSVSSATIRRKSADVDGLRSRRMQGTDTLRLYRSETDERDKRTPTSTRPEHEQVRIALHPNSERAHSQPGSSRVQKRHLPRPNKTADPLFTLTEERTREASAAASNQNKTRSHPADTDAENRARNHPPANTATHVRVRQRSRKHRLLIRPLIATVIFVSVFAISYGYLKLNPGKYEYSVGRSFESDDPTANLKDPVDKNALSDAEQGSETYVYAQKETSSDLLNLTLSSLLPGPENIQELGISENISGHPPASLEQSLDAETALRSIQSQEHQNHVLEKESTQIIEEVIAENKSQKSTSEPAPDSQQRRITASSIEDDNERPLSTNTPKRTRPLDAKDTGIEFQGGRLVINRDLENAIRQYTPMVERLNSGSLKITLNSEFSFEPDSARLKQGISLMLDKLAFVMRNYEGFLIKVIAQEDYRNTAAYGSGVLSRKRAETITAYFIHHGISAHRVLKGSQTEKNPPTVSATDVRGRNGQHPEIGIYLTPKV